MGEGALHGERRGEDCNGQTLETTNWWASLQRTSGVYRRQSRQSTDVLPNKKTLEPLALSTGLTTFTVYCVGAAGSMTGVQDGHETLAKFCRVWGSGLWVSASNIWKWWHRERRAGRGQYCTYTPGQSEWDRFSWDGIAVQVLHVVMMLVLLKCQMGRQQSTQFRPFSPVNWPSSPLLHHVDGKFDRTTRPVVDSINKVMSVLHPASFFGAPSILHLAIAFLARLARLAHVDGDTAVGALRPQ